PILANDPELAVKLWLSYNRALLTLVIARPERCVLANVAAIVADPPAWVATVASRSGQPLNAPDAAIFEPALLHGQRSRDRSSLMARFYPDVVELYASLERHAAFRPAVTADVEPWRHATPDADRLRALRDWHELCAALVERDRLKVHLERALAALERAR